MQRKILPILMIILLASIAFAANLPPPASALPPPPSFGSSSSTTSSTTTSTTTTTSGTTDTTQKAGILNTLYGKSSGSSTVTLGSGKVVGSTGKGTYPSTGLSTSSADDLDALPDSFLGTSSNTNINTNTRTTGTSSSISELTEDDVRRIVREELDKTEQFSSGSNGVLWMAMLLLLIGGGIIGYIVWNRKKSSSSSSLPKIKIPQKVVVPMQLTQYINANAHFGKVSLRKSLIASGWNPDQVRQALINSGL